jgi:SAM-dependent methyltransferase
MQTATRHLPASQILRHSATHNSTAPYSPSQSYLAHYGGPLLQLNDRLSLGQHRVWKRMAVKWCGAAPGQRALDVCCGSGDLAMLLAAAVGPSGCVTGLDFAADMLQVRGRACCAALCYTLLFAFSVSLKGCRNIHIRGQSNEALRSILVLEVPADAWHLYRSKASTQQACCRQACVHAACIFIRSSALAHAKLLVCCVKWFARDTSGAATAIFACAAVMQLLTHPRAC